MGTWCAPSFRDPGQSRAPEGKHLLNAVQHVEVTPQIVDSGLWIVVLVLYVDCPNALEMIIHDPGALISFYSLSTVSILRRMSCELGELVDHASESDINHNPSK